MKENKHYNGCIICLVKSNLITDLKPLPLKWFLWFFVFTDAKVTLKVVLSDTLFL